MIRKQSSSNGLSEVEVAFLKIQAEKRKAENLAEIGSALPDEAISGSPFCKTVARSVPEVILLVEDESFVRVATAGILESAGYTCLLAGSGAEALSAYLRYSKPIDLLISDIVMPGMSGQELAAAFHNWCPQGRILLMSGYVKLLARSELSSFRNAHLAKPFSMHTLLRRVREALDSIPLNWGASA